MKAQKQIGVRRGKGANSGYKYVTGSPDRHGKIRWRYSRRGHPSCYLPHPESPDFLDAYHSACKSVHKPHKRPEDSFDAAIDRYLRSKAFGSRKPLTQKNYKRRLNILGEKYGGHSIKTLTRPELLGVLEESNSPSERNRTLSIFKIVLQESVEQEIISHNVAASISRVKFVTKGYTSWTRADIKQYLEYHKDDETATLALLLLYYTGQRGSDIAIAGTHNIKLGRIVVEQGKTGAIVDIPIHPELAKVLPERSGVWLLNAYGQPFSVKGFQQRFVKWAVSAGITGKSAHGLRKALATHLAEGGATPHEIQAVTGHKTLSEVERYTAAANLKKLADSAFNKLT